MKNKYTKNILEHEMKWIDVDLDNTLAKGIWPKRGIGEPIQDAKESLDYLTENGYKIIIFTARPWSDYINVEKWLNDNEFKYSRIVCGKPLIRFSIDDRNIEFLSWKKAIKKIKKKK